MPTNNRVMFNQVVICPSPFDRNTRYECKNKNLDGYNNYLQQNPAMCEFIGEFNTHIKPVFDVDAMLQDIDINAVKQDINKIFPNKPIYYAKRESRDDGKGMKYSYRFYVDKVMIYSKHIKTLMEHYGLDKNPIYDTSIYACVINIILVKLNVK